MALPRRSSHLALALAGSLAATTATAAELVVQWAPMAARVESYQVERRVDDGRADFTPIARVAADATRFVDRGVAAGTRYCYRVRGVRGESVSAPSAPLCNVARERAVGDETAARTATEQPSAAAASSAAPAAEPGHAQRTPAEADASPTPAALEAEASPAAAAGSAARRAEAAGPPAAQDLAAAAAAEPSADPAASATAVPSAVAQPAPTSARPSEVREVKPLRRPRPAYPAYAQLNGISGWVKLRFTVAASGSTRDVEVVAAEPPGVFDAAALEAARQFVYSPRLEDGVAVDRRNVETEITFTWIQRGGAVITEHLPPARR